MSIIWVMVLWKRNNISVNEFCIKAMFTSCGNSKVIFNKFGKINKVTQAVSGHNNMKVCHFTPFRCHLPWTIKKSSWQKYWHDLHKCFLGWLRSKIVEVIQIRWKSCLLKRCGSFIIYMYLIFLTISIALIWN